MLIREVLVELSFMGSPCTKDCSGHKAGYKWSLDHGGRTANSHSNSFNNGTNIAAAQKAKRAQGGGKLPGYTSQTVNAQRKRAARAQAKQQSVQPVPAGQQPQP
jgi:hypothetical protein